MADCAFDPETHQYTIGGRRVPSVTQVLGDLLPGWRASEFYLGRGRAVHACAALVAKGVDFEHDPRIAGQIEAVRRFFREVGPEVIDVEQHLLSERYQFGGTPDLMGWIPGDRSLVVFDYKATLTPTTVYQCAGYALLYDDIKPITIGYGVELHQDGTYRLSEPYDLKIPKREFLSLLTTYRIRERLGLTNKEDNNHE